MSRPIKPLILLLCLALLLGAALWLGWAVRATAPRYAGELALTGLAAPVTVRFGAHAVPSIAGDSVADVLFAQGYVVASERLWQMDLLRRLAQGRLAEVFGPDALPADPLRTSLADVAAGERGRPRSGRSSPRPGCAG